MFPIVAIGSVIGAAFSIAKGASWLLDQLDSGKDTAAAASKATGKPVTEAKAAEFQSVLAAQVAGQPVPATPSAPITVPLPHGPDYDAAARVKAGVIAYNHIGERRDNHAKPHPTTDDGEFARA